MKCPHNLVGAGYWLGDSMQGVSGELIVVYYLVSLFAVVLIALIISSLTATILKTV